MTPASASGSTVKKNSRVGIFVVLSIILILGILAVPIVLVATGVGSTPAKVVDPDEIPPKKPFDLSKISMEDRNRIDCFLEAESRFENLTRFQCEHVRSCTFAPTEYQRVPDCYFRRDIVGYELVEATSTPNTETYRLRRSTRNTPTYLEPIENLVLSVEYLSHNIMHVKIEDEDDPDRYQVPYELNKPNPIDDKAKSKARFSYTTDMNRLFQFKITRASDQEIIFDTTMGAFAYHNQFIQIATRLSSSYLYGFGENNHEKLLHDFNFRSWGMFTRDFAPGWAPNRNLYGFQPVYYSINEKNSKGHLVLLYNSNAMEYLFTPTPSLTLRTIGGILDFYFVVDDQPERIFQTYHNLIGKPMFPPYWSLGFQISRWGYKKLDDVKTVVERTKAVAIPQDVQYIDIEYMIGYRILTIDQINFKGLSDYQKELEQNGIKLVLIEDPGLVIERNNSYYMFGINRKDGGIYIKWLKNIAPYDRDTLNKDDMISWCWPNAKISYPDYLYEDTHTWWEESLRDFMAPSSIAAGNGTNMNGIWIDMNEPSSFETNELRPWNWLWPDNDQDRYPHFTLKCPTNKYDDPPYRTKNAFAYDGDDVLVKKARLSQKTLCMVATQRHNGKEYFHYDVHNLYGHSQAIATFNAMRNIKDSRPFVLTRSNFVGTGRYAAHWLGDNDSKWKHMRMSIIGAIEYSIFGFSMIGADICGFFEAVRDAEMCTRWLQLGAFYTFSRNHNSNNEVDKDPASFNDPILEESTRNALNIRYTILPYIYTTLYNIHRNGGTAIKALHFEFPNDKQTYAIDEQFLLGKHLLVSPVLYPVWQILESTVSGTVLIQRRSIFKNATTVRAYIPNARWYDYRTGEEVSTKGWVILDAPITYIPLHLRGGSIIPIQNPADCLNTECSRKKPLGLIVSPDENQSASGEFYWDDGDTLIDYDLPDSGDYFYALLTYQNKVLTMTVDKSYPNAAAAKLDDIRISGVESVSAPGVVVNGADLDPAKVKYDNARKLLTLSNLQVEIGNGLNVEISTN